MTEKNKDVMEMDGMHIMSDAELNRKLDILLKTGCLLMESLADTSRVLRNMKRVAAYLGFHEQNLHISINYDIILANLSDEYHSFTKFRRCEGHSVNLWTIMKVSKLTWNCIRDDYSLERYEEELDAIRKHKRSYTPWEVAIGGGFACGGFCIQFGCDWTAFFYASIAAILGFRFRMWLGAKKMNAYVSIAVAAFVSTILAWGFMLLSTHTDIEWLRSKTPYHPFMACALYIVPGVPLINFVSCQDRHNTCRKHVDDCIGNGIRYSFRHKRLRSGQLCERFIHDPSP